MVSVHAYRLATTYVLRHANAGRGDCSARSCHSLSIHIKFASAQNPRRIVGELMGRFLILFFILYCPYVSEIRHVSNTAVEKVVFRLFITQPMLPQSSLTTDVDIARSNLLVIFQSR